MSATYPCGVRSEKMMFYVIVFASAAVSLVSGQAPSDQTCPSGAIGVQTVVEILNTSSWDHDVEDRLSNALNITWPSSFLRLHPRSPLQTQVHLEVLKCGTEISPVQSHSMAVAAHQVLGGGSFKWSVAANPPPLNEDLSQYIAMFNDLSEQKELVVSRKSSHADVAIWRLGNRTRFILNNVVMSDSHDEHIYHEMLVHPALLAVEKPKQVLIIGGGEGAVLREVLRNEHVENITMVDIDESLITLCREHLAMMHHGSFDSPKVKLLFGDGAAFLESSPPQRYDAIIVDGIDFHEDGDARAQNAPMYGNILFSKRFFDNAFQTLRPGGVLVQYMSDFDRLDYADNIFYAGFTGSQRLCVDIPSFFGAGACFGLAAKAPPEDVATRITRLVKETPNPIWTYLSTQTLIHSLNHVSRRLKGGGGSHGHHGGDGDMGGGGCFPGEALADVRGQGQKTVASLQVGDEVLVELASGELAYEPVLAFIHVVRGASRKEHLTVQHARGSFHASAEHLVFVVDSSGRNRVSKMLSDLQASDYLLVAHAGRGMSAETVLLPSKVLQVHHSMSSSGLFAPLTPAGTIVIDGVVASNYASPARNLVLPHHWAHLVMLPVRWYHRFGLASLLAPLWRQYCPGLRSDRTVGAQSWLCSGSAHKHGEEEEVDELHPWAAVLFKHLSLQRFLPAKAT